MGDSPWSFPSGRTCKAEREAWLAGQLGAFNDLYDRLGEAGRRLRRDFAAAACPERIDPHILNHGSYSALHRHIRYGSAQTRMDFFETVAHERIHAIQHATVPATFAHVAFKAAPVRLTPRQTLWLADLMEREAYVKSALLSLRAAEQGNLSQDSYPVGAMAVYLARLRDGNRRLAAVNKELDDYLEKLAVYHGQGGPVPGLPSLETRDMTESELAAACVTDVYDEKLARRYHRRLSVLFAICAPLLRLNDNKNSIYARLGPEDVAALSSALGVVLPSPTAPPAFSRMTNLRLRFASAVLGVPRDESALPTFGEALQSLKLSPEAFVAQVRAAKPQ